jgi:uncharacterized Zn-finger protein
VYPFCFQTSDTVKGNGDSDSSETDDSFTQEDQEEQEIIKNIREDLENHKRNNVHSGSVNPNINYKEKTVACERQDVVQLAGCSETYVHASCKQPTNIRLTVKQEQTEGQHSSATMEWSQSGAHNRNSATAAQDAGTLPTISHLQHFTEQGLPFICTKCPKKFAKRIDLRRHESVHNQQRGFECPVCEKWFPNKTSFGRHERTHTGERPYSCSQCGKSFSQGAILARHIMTHTGIKPFKCEVCNKGFTQREGLRVHMRQHTKEQPEIQLHECPLCEKSFCHPSGLSRHLIIHTGKTFDCTVCPKVFTDSSSLRRHMKRHEDNPEPPQEHNST